LKKADALAWGRKVEADMQAGRWTPASEQVPTLAEALKTYRAAVVVGMKGADSYAWTLDELQGLRVASKPVDQVTASDVAAWRDDMAARGLAPGTIVRRLGLLSGLFTWAHKERGWITGNPVQSVRKPRVSDSRDRVLTMPEREWLLAGAAGGRNEWLADALVVLLESAMRRSELWGLTVDALDLTAHVALLSDTKNGSARGVPLTATAAQALARLAQAASVATAKARAAKRGDAPAPGQERLIPVSDAPAVSLAFRRALARAQGLYLADCQRRGVKPEPGFLEGVHLHDLRHSSITMWATTGALSVHELMAISGHKTTAMLSRYVNLKAADLARKLATINTGTQTASPEASALTV
jgi:integrase